MWYRFRYHVLFLFNYGVKLIINTSTRCLSTLFRVRYHVSFLLPVYLRVIERRFPCISFHDSGHAYFSEMKKEKIPNNVDVKL